MQLILLSNKLLLQKLVKQLGSKKERRESKNMTDKGMLKESMSKKAREKGKHVAAGKSTLFYFYFILILVLNVM